MIAEYIGIVLSTVSIGGLGFLFLKFVIDVIRGKYRTGQS